MSKIVFVDTYYPEVFKKPELRQIPPENMDCPYGNSKDRRQIQLDKLHFGTSYYYRKSFEQMGWTAEDVIINDPLIFCEPYYGFNHIKNLEPDIVYCQDLNALSYQQISYLKSRGTKVVAQHSCPWAGDETVRQYDIVFTSFPHYIKRIQNVGTRAEFLPIAFGHWVLDHVQTQKRDIDILFVGGVNGSSGHWYGGTRTLEAVAHAFPKQFQWYGYKIGNFNSDSPLVSTYRGEAWGIEMYNLLARAKIVINRHGEVAEGYSNNMRMFEATGMGALLCTEDSKNLDQYFERGAECVGYMGCEHLIAVLKVLLADHTIIDRLASRGQQRTLAEHIYEKRLAAIEPLLKELIK